jgi:hypothetical protein
MGVKFKSRLLDIFNPDQEILVVSPEQLRHLAWIRYNEFQEKKIPNKGYNTLGVPISLLQVRKIVVAIKNLSCIMLN